MRQPVVLVAPFVRIGLRREHELPAADRLVGLDEHGTQAGRGGDVLPSDDWRARHGDGREGLHIR